MGTSRKPASEHIEATAAGSDNAGTNPAAAEPLATHLRVRATRDGYRRCGRVWGAQPQVVHVSEFNDADIARLFSDPCLLVHVLCEDPAEPE